jgi:hypothetical protein
MVMPGVSLTPQTMFVAKEYDSGHCLVDIPPVILQIA